jgi:alkylhydroperoxidase family enzyme
VLGAVVGVGRVPRPVHLPSVIAQHPTYLPPYLSWAKAIALDGVLSPRHNEILALRTGYRCRSNFEWGVHTQYALGRGCLNEEEIAAVAHGPGAPRWDPIEQALLRAADELHEDAVIGDTTWNELARVFDHAALLEVVFVVGHYTMLSMVTNSAGVQPEAGWPSVPR